MLVPVVKNPAMREKTGVEIPRAERQTKAAGAGVSGSAAPSYKPDRRDPRSGNLVNNAIVSELDKASQRFIKMADDAEAVKVQNEFDEQMRALVADEATREGEDAYGGVNRMKDAAANFLNDNKGRLMYATQKNFENSVSNSTRNRLYSLAIKEATARETVSNKYLSLGDENDITNVGQAPDEETYLQGMESITRRYDEATHLSPSARTADKKQALNRLAKSRLEGYNAINAFDRADEFLLSLKETGVLTSSEYYAAKEKTENRRKSAIQDADASLARIARAKTKASLARVESIKNDIVNGKGEHTLKSIVNDPELAGLQEREALSFLETYRDATATTAGLSKKEIQKGKAEMDVLLITDPAKLTLQYLVDASAQGLIDPDDIASWYDKGQERVKAPLNASGHIEVLDHMESLNKIGFFTRPTGVDDMGRPAFSDADNVRGDKSYRAVIAEVNRRKLDPENKLTSAQIFDQVAEPYFKAIVAQSMKDEVGWHIKESEEKMVVERAAVMTDNFFAAKLVEPSPQERQAQMDKHGAQIHREAYNRGIADWKREEAVKRNYMQTVSDKAYSLAMEEADRREIAVDSDEFNALWEAICDRIMEDYTGLAQGAN